MATNFYFNNFTNSQEQQLIENLIIESIKIYGHDVYYCPRRAVEKDEIYGEDPLSKYNTSYMIEMYIKSVDGFEGDGTFLSKFGLEIRDQVTLTVARRIFDEEVGQFEATLRPNEGDLIYFPVAKRLLIVKYADHKPVFYQLGGLQMYDLICEQFEYSGERLNTGIEDIDNIERAFSLDIAGYSLLTSGGSTIVDSSGWPILVNGYGLPSSFSDLAGGAYEDNEEIQAEADGFIDFSEKDPFSEGGL
jgi:hypothetical protein